jgi:CHAT domain-containing protein
MVDVFRRSHAGIDNLNALDAARNQLRQSSDATQVSRAHPYFWAPFVYVGD